MAPVLFSSSPPRVLSIAGSDPSGGAGIQADLKTMSSLGAYGMSILTALTAQSTTGVKGIHRIPPEFVKQQINVVRSDVRIDAIKMGMLADEKIINSIAEEFSLWTSEGREQVPIVLDPVMVSTSGSLLLTHASINDLVHSLLPFCTVLTPNLPEAKQLLTHSTKGTKLSLDVSNPNDNNLSTLPSLLEAAKRLCDLGPRATLIKGGHQVMKRGTVDRALKQLGIVTDTSREDSDASSREEYVRREEERLGAEVVMGKVMMNGSVFKAVIIRTDGQPWADVLRQWKPKDGEGKQEEEKVVEEGERDVVVDVLYEASNQEYTLFIKPHVESTSTHGTGCTLSSALATYLAAGNDIRQSTHRSITYVQSAIARGLSDLGHGPGPLNHLANTTRRPILAPSLSRGSGSERAPLCGHLIAHSLPFWRQFTHHLFLQRLSVGKLDKESFVWFLRQDYLFLCHYARVWASGASNGLIGNSFEKIATFAGIASEMALEAKEHVKICERWGISKQELDGGTKESAATLAYTRFVLDISRSGDALELLAATGPCLLGYGEAGVWLGKAWKEANFDHFPSDDEREAYGGWIRYYSGDEFQEIVRKGIEDMERYASSDPPSVARLENLQRIWNAAVRLEIGMWDEALDKGSRRLIVDP